MKRKKKLDIKSAIKRPGSLTKKAEKEGLTPRQYANKYKKAKGLKGQQARFALTLLKISKKRRTQ